jgi:hypothetical protein
MESNLKAPGTKCLKVKYDNQLSNVALNFNLRRYNKADIVSDLIKLEGEQVAKVGRCRLTLSNTR